MLSRTTVKLDKAIYEGAKDYAKAKGYATVDEFVSHLVEREIKKMDDPDLKEKIIKKMKGLGYLD